MEPTYKKYDIHDYIKKKFGHLTVIGEARKTNKYSNQFLFLCDCGTPIQEQPARVINGHRSSCGQCKFAGLNVHPRFDINDYIGKKCGKLTVVGLAEKSTEEKLWKLRCKCECGKFTNLTPSQFNRCIVKSCGCLKGKTGSSKDGRSNHPLYNIWLQMMYRCYKPSAKYYNRYGGRGIIVCDEWHDFWKFVEWSDSIGGRPPGHSIDRIDNDGPYSPQNCRWTIQKEQVRNQSRNIVLEYNGTSKCLAEWAEDLGINWVTLHNRYIRGWSVERMLTEPVHKK